MCFEIKQHIQNGLLFNNFNLSILDVHDRIYLPYFTTQKSETVQICSVFRVGSRDSGSKLETRNSRVQRATVEDTGGYCGGYRGLLWRIQGAIVEDTGGYCRGYRGLL